MLAGSGTREPPPGWYPTELFGYGPTDAIEAWNALMWESDATGIHTVLINDDECTREVHVVLNRTPRTRHYVCPVVDFNDGHGDDGGWYIGRFEIRDAFLAELRRPDAGRLAGYREIEPEARTFPVDDHDTGGSYRIHDPDG